MYAAISQCPCIVSSSDPRNVIASVQISAMTFLFHVFHIRVYHALIRSRFCINTESLESFRTPCTELARDRLRCERRWTAQARAWTAHRPIPRCSLAANGRRSRQSHLPRIHSFVENFIDEGQRYRSFADCRCHALMLPALTSPTANTVWQARFEEMGRAGERPARRRQIFLREILARCDESVRIQRDTREAGRFLQPRGRWRSSWKRGFTPSVARQAASTVRRVPSHSS